MNKPLNVVFNKAEKKAIINLYGVIGDAWQYDNPLTAQKFQRALMSAEKEADIIDVHIHSPGGSVFEGMAICNAIKASKKTVNTYNDGICASMGAVILSSAKDGHRFAAKGSLTMLHNASTIAWGNAKYLRGVADDLDTFDKTLAGYFADATGKTTDDIIAEYFDGKDHWLSSEETENLGIAKILDYEKQETPENIKNLSIDQIAAYFNGEILTQTQPQNNNEPDMSLLGTNKFKKLHALAKVAASAITSEQLEAINNEIAEAEVEGVTMVLTKDLEDTIANSEKVTGLEASITAKDAEIEKLKNEVAAQKKKLDAPAEEPITPVAETDDQPEGKKKEVENYATSVDAELKAYLS